MSKFGVGVGDDFPVDDGRGNAAGADQGQRADNPGDDRAEYEEWKRRRDAQRAQRDEWRRQRDGWKARKRAFKERVRAAARESFGQEWDDYRRGQNRFDGHRHRFPFFFWPVFGLLIPILIVAIFISLISAVFKSPFLFLGLVLLAFLFFSHRHHHYRDRYRDFGPRDYDFDLKPANGPSTPSGPIVTPPPSPPAAPSGK